MKYTRKYDYKHQN